MSNLGQFNSQKNPAWGRTNTSPNMVPQNNQGAQIMPQIMNQGLNSINNSGMLQFQQQHPQVFQSAMGIQQQNISLGLQQIANNAIGASNQIFQQVSSVSYPNPRALNTAAFQTPQSISQMPQLQSSTNTNSGTKQRVFTGTVTKVHDNFGFVDEDVFFQTNACVKGSNPVVGDRVLVEASFNPSMPFKWNATRIQVLPTSGHNQQQSVRHSNNSAKNNYNNSSGYNAVPPPESNNSFGNSRSGNRSKASVGGRGRERSRDRERDDEEVERKRRREERQREREKEDKKSPVRRRSRSPKSRRRTRIVPRYMVQIPKIALNLLNADVLELRRRYGNMYIPSDYFYSNFQWVNAFPPNKPFSLSKPCFFHVMSKDVEPIVENDAVMEPADADYLFSAKVMLMNVPGMDELYNKCCAMAEDEDKKDRDVIEKDYIHPSRLINFLVGLRGKSETMAIGGPWSPSLDGPNPEEDPSVLIKTAIRTCRALTGINLSNCGQWYRFTELYYRRNETVHKGKIIPPRIETVVIYLPDVWSCVPTRLEWDNLLQSYQKQLERELKADQDTSDENQPSDEKEEDQSVDRLEPTHHSVLDIKTMTVTDLKKELKARNISTKGLKSQLVAKLSKVLKQEAEKGNEEVKEAIVEAELDDTQEDKKLEVEEKKLDDKEKALLQKRYTLPDQQHIIVHPSKTAKSGKFDCTVMSLSLLLDYRPEDTKEHSFEVSLFAELFNEMLMRDFGFNIYKALYELPEKPKEKDESKKREKDGDDKKKPDDKKKDDDRKKNVDKKKEEDKNKEDEKEKKEDKKNDEYKDKDEKRFESKKKENRSDDSEEEDDGDAENKDKKKDKDKRKSRVKLYTKHKHLLLSFVYFDQTHCGYIFDKDIEDLLYTLGLNLSRSQVRKLVGKVITRDSLHYRKLTDKPKDEEITDKEDDVEEISFKDLPIGNGKVFPIFKSGKIQKCNPEESQEGSREGMVMFNGALIDVEKLMSQLERSDKARLEAESRVLNLKLDNTKLTDKYDKTALSMKRMNLDLKECKEKLRSTEDILSKTTAYSKLYQTTLTEVRDKIDSVLKSTSVNKEEVMKKEKESERDKKEKDEAKSRWEKEIKTETMDIDDLFDKKY